MAGIEILNVTISEDKKEIQDLVIAKLRPSWEARKVRVESKTGGNINPAPLVYHLVDDTDITDGIVVRLFGPNSAVTCREREICAMQIAHHAGCFPRVLALFDNGVVYQYAPGECLKDWQITDPKMSRLIARRLAQLHFSDIENTQLVNRQGQSVTWPREFVTFDRLNSAIDSFAYGSRKFPLLECMSDEVKYVQGLIAGLDFPTAPCCHGDFNPLNIVYNSETEAVCFVDYEFAGCRLSAYDFMVIFDIYIYQDLLPGFPTSGERLSEQTRTMWVTAYLERKNELLGQVPTDPPNVEVDKMLKELEIVEVFTPMVFAGVLLAFYDPSNPLPLAELFSRAMETYLKRKASLPRLIMEYRQIHLSE